MNMISNKINRISGISLLELMLSLSIIAFVIVLATRYYETSKQSQQLSQTMIEINAIMAAAEQWRATHDSYDSYGTTPAMSWVELRSRGLLPEAMFQGDSLINPYGRSYLLLDVDVNEYKFRVDGIGDKSCKAALDHYGRLGNITATCRTKQLRLTIED